MNALTNAETIKDCRRIAATYGMTFKRDNSLTLNGSPAYKFTVRRTGRTIRANMTLGMAYNVACSGELSSF
jgi:hypothetical protein